MSSLPARAAAVRGDDFQHILGLFYALDVVLEPTTESVSIEDADGGAFDDVVLRSSPGSPTRYFQIKSSVYRNTTIDHKWLTTPVAKSGKSPLQRFHETWSQLRTSDGEFQLHLVTNRAYHPDDPILKLVDTKTERLSLDILEAAGPRSKAGKQLAVWAKHLDVESADLHAFLSEVYFSVAESETNYRSHVASKMRNAGLRDDAEAVEIGQSMVRGWVTDGVRVVGQEDLFRFFVDKQLLARGTEVTLAIHAVDVVGLGRPANVELDFRELYDEGEPFQRRQLARPDDWASVVVPALAEAKGQIVRYSSRKVHVEATMRLPMHFLVGRTFPKVAKWDLSIHQSGATWSTSHPDPSATVEVLVDERLSEGPEVAVAIALSSDPTNEIRSYLADLPGVGRLITLSLPGGPNVDAVPTGEWAAGWAYAAREQVRATSLGAPRLHLFMAAPAAIALFLGHVWNMVPDTLPYEHTAPGYSPTVIIPG